MPDPSVTPSPVPPLAAIDFKALGATEPAALAVLLRQRLAAAFEFPDSRFGADPVGVLSADGLDFSLWWSWAAPEGGWRKDPHALRRFIRPFLDDVTQVVKAHLAERDLVGDHGDIPRVDH